MDMLFKYFISLLIMICLMPVGAAAQSNTEELNSNCYAALQQDINQQEARQTITALIKEIENQEKLYLKSALYPDVRRCYEKLLAKLGEYYFKQKKFSNARDFFVKADKFSDIGYRKKIEACEKIMAQDIEFENLIAKGTRYYNQKKYEDAEFAFKRALRIKPGEPGIREYLQKINQWEKIRVITPRTFLDFIKKYPQSPILPGLKNELTRKYPNLPPESFLPYLNTRTNTQGYWEAEINGHTMVYIPGKPQGIGGFFVDKYEVSFAQLENVKGFKKKRSKSKIPLIRRLTPQHPAVVDFKEAQEYCQKKGFRLLTELEWEVAAGKYNGNTYSWGTDEVDAWESEQSRREYRANYDAGIIINKYGPANFKDGYETAAPVKTFGKYASPYGLVNLSGNVWEWVQGKKCKGGGFMSQKQDLKITAASKDEAWVGFRCVKDVKK
jgi:tetratricopeptide (TPR) repeat protein